MFGFSRFQKNNICSKFTLRAQKNVIPMKIFIFLIEILDNLKISADTHIVACFEPERRKHAIDNSKR